MAFEESQTRKLRRKPAPRYVKERLTDGKLLHYLEGHYLIDQANRIFGFDGWDRETVYAHCVASRIVQGRVQSSYLTRVRISVRAGSTLVTREGLGAGEAIADTAGQAHERAAKAAETDATKRALSTFGAPFGLTLYASKPDQIPTRRIAQQACDSGSQAKPAPIGSDQPGQSVDKSTLMLSEPKRHRNKDHLKFVASLGCLICGRKPAQAHHLTHAQPRAMQRKTSDEFTVPLCAIHHDSLHRRGSEREWWYERELDPIRVANDLWAVTLGQKSAASVSLDQYLVRAKQTFGR